MKEILNLLKIEFKKNLKLSRFFFILILLIISSLFLTGYSYKTLERKNVYNYYIYNQNETKKSYEINKKIYEENKTLENEYKYEISKLNKEILDIALDKKILFKDDYRFNYLHELDNVKRELLLKEMASKGYKVEETKLLRSYDVLKTEEIKYLEKINTKYYEEEKLIKESLEQELKLTTNENDRKRLEESIKLSEYIIEEKIENNMNPYVIEIKSLKSVLSSKYFIPLSYDEFIFDDYYNKIYKSYDEYLEINLNNKKEIEKYSDLIWYSLNNKIILNDKDVLNYEMPFNSKNIFNEIYFLGIIILILFIIFYSNIMASEFNNKTINILATKVNRYKIIISKLLFLILAFLMFYIISYTIMFLIIYFKYDINDIFHNELVISNTIVEINYLKMIFINILNHSLIILLIFSVLLLISTIIKNISLIISFMLSFSFLSYLIPYLESVDLKILSYLPFSYLNYIAYLEGIKFLNITQNELFIISVILIMAVVVINILIINKKDIDVK